MAAASRGSDRPRRDPEPWQTIAASAKPASAALHLAPPLGQHRQPVETVGNADLVAPSTAGRQQALVELAGPLVRSLGQRRPRQQPERAMATEPLRDRLVTGRQGLPRRGPRPDRDRLERRRRSPGGAGRRPAPRHRPRHGPPPRPRRGAAARASSLRGQSSMFSPTSASARAAVAARRRLPPAPAPATPRPRPGGRAAARTRPVLPPGAGRSSPLRAPATRSAPPAGWGARLEHEQAAPVGHGPLPAAPDPPGSRTTSRGGRRSPPPRRSRASRSRPNSRIVSSIS